MITNSGLIMGINKVFKVTIQSGRRECCRKSLPLDVIARRVFTLRGNLLAGTGDCHGRSLRGSLAMTKISVLPHSVRHFPSVGIVK